MNKKIVWVLFSKNEKEKFFGLTKLLLEKRWFRRWIKGNILSDNLIWNSIGFEDGSFYLFLNDEIKVIYTWDKNDLDPAKVLLRDFDEVAVFYWINSKHRWQTKETAPPITISSKTYTVKDWSHSWNFIVTDNGISIPGKSGHDKLWFKDSKQSVVENFYRALGVFLNEIGAGRGKSTAKILDDDAFGKKEFFDTLS